MKFTANEIAEQVKGEVVGDGDIELAGFAQTNVAKPGDLTFAENEKYFRLAEESQASAILAPNEFTSEVKTVLPQADPHWRPGPEREIKDHRALEPAPEGAS